MIKLFINIVLKIVLEAPSCNNLWSTERWPGYQLRGFQLDVIRGLSRTQCIERCLEETRFVCR